MKLIFSLILMTMLSGCVYQSVNNRDIQDAATICGKIENVSEIRAYSFGSEVVKCNNREWYNIDENLLKGK